MTWFKALESVTVVLISAVLFVNCSNLKSANSNAVTLPISNDDEPGQGSDFEDALSRTCGLRPVQKSFAFQVLKLRRVEVAGR